MMAKLYWQAFGGMLFLISVMAAALFLPAWTTSYWQAWVFLAVFSVSVTAITLYLVKRDPQLLARRVKAGPAAEKEKTQQIIQSIAGLAFLAIFVVSALDHRFSWSILPNYLVFIGDVLVAVGLWIVFRVFRENSFTSATIEVGADQRVISTGPYAIVRHPMYTGAFVMLAGVPLALASWWGMLAVIPLVSVIIWRIFDEEKFLARRLAGYADYLASVRYRLLPGIW
jgi:protein-S-isoprenylcysteine O-methyltransferase Ste14